MTPLALGFGIGVPFAPTSGGGAFVVTLNKQPVTLSGQKITIKKVS